LEADEQSAFFIFSQQMKLQKIFRYLLSAYTPDQRSLALMRITVAIIVVVDLVIRGSDLKAHYTDFGIWPSNVMKLGWKAGYWSIHALNTSIGWITILFIVHGLVALSLLLGFRTQLSSLVLFVLYISLDNRNIFINQAGDDLLRLVLMWGIFLPWGNCFSLDKKNGRIRTGSFFAGIGYFLLIASVYLFSALLKSSPEWHSEGSALYFALSLEQLRLPAGDWVYHYPGFLRVMTWIIYFTELLIPFLIILPSRNGQLRIISFFLILFLHISIGLTLYVGLFFLIGISTAIGLLPTQNVDWICRFFKLKNKEEIPALSGRNTWIETFCALVVAVCVFINLSSLKYFHYKLREDVSIGTNFLRLDQFWGMFSPTVLKKDGWLVYHGKDSIGRQWDLRLDQDYVSYKKPEHIVRMYATDRWRKFAENMQDDHFTFLRPLYCSYILKRWNRLHPHKKLRLMDLYFMEKENLADYKTTTPVKKLYCVCDEQ
jgi:hypothetical protein